MWESWRSPRPPSGQWRQTPQVPVRWLPASRLRLGSSLPLATVIGFRALGVLFAGVAAGLVWWAAPVRGREVSVTGGAGEMVPSFAEDVRHYAVRCEPLETLRVTAVLDAAVDGAVRVLLNGEPVGEAGHGLPVLLADDEALTVAFQPPGAVEATTYTVHCVPLDFPEVKVVRKVAGRGRGLLLVAPYYNESGAEQPVSWLAMVDDNGVPRFRRRVSPGAHNFRWHENARRYSYNEARPNGAGEVVLLDERLEEVARVGTAGGLEPAMMHEFLITDEGNYLFVVNQPAVRDLGRYPAVGEDDPVPARAQATVDAVIQEVTPDGREVFRWNAWDHLKLSDCRWWRFPEEYAKLNSLHLSAGHLVASFRACSTVLKIERPSGRVLWQLGGSDPAEPDRFDHRRPTFKRAWYRPTADPRDGFCAQHSVLETEPGRLLLFDNGQCPDGTRPSSRVVEYRLLQRGGQEGGGEAVFVHHHEPGRLTLYGGAVTLLPNGNWLIAWGGGVRDATLSEVDPSGAEVLVLRLFRDSDPAMTYRVWRHPEAVAPLRLPGSTTAAPGSAGGG